MSGSNRWLWPWLMVSLTAITIGQLPTALAAIAATGDLSIVPTTFTTYLEGNIETKTTTTEAYPTLFDDTDVFGNIYCILYYYLVYFIIYFLFNRIKMKEILMRQGNMFGQTDMYKMRWVVP